MARPAGSVDTNVVLRLLLNDAVIEMVFALDRYYGFTRLQIAEAVDGFMKLQKISCNQALFERALPLYVNHPGLSFEDCCLTVYAQLTNAEPLWTFDKKLATQVPNAELIAA